MSGSREREMKREIAAGELAAEEVILGCPWQAHSMSISDLLMSQKRWGRARCRRLLITIGMPENKRVGHSYRATARRPGRGVLSSKGAGQPAATALRRLRPGSEAPRSPRSNPVLARPSGALWTVAGAALNSLLLSAWRTRTIPH